MKRNQQKIRGSERQKIGKYDGNLGRKDGNFREIAWGMKRAEKKDDKIRPSTFCSFRTLPLTCDEPMTKLEMEGI